MDDSSIDNIEILYEDDGKMIVSYADWARLEAQHLPLYKKGWEEGRKPYLLWKSKKVYRSLPKDIDETLRDIIDSNARWQKN